MIRAALGSLQPLVPRTTWGRIVAMALVGLLVRLSYVFVAQWGGPLSGDGIYYHEAANLMADGLGFTEPYRYLYGGGHETLFVNDPAAVVVTANSKLPIGHIEPTAGHPPLWVVFLGVFSFFGLTSVGSHQVISAMVGASGVLAVGLTAQQVERSTGISGVALPAAALTAVHASFWLNDGLLMSETLIVPLTALLLGSALQFNRRPAVNTAVVLGVVAGLAALTRAELMVALPLITIGVLRRPNAAIPGVVPRGGKPPRVYCLKMLAIVGLTFMLIVAPWIVRNLAVFEDPVLLSNGSGILLAQANCDATYYGDKQGYWEYQCGLPQPLGADGMPIDESQRDVIYRQRGLDYIAAHPGRLVTHVVPKRIARYWGAYAPIQQLRADVLVENRPMRLSVLGYAQFLAVSGLGLVGITALLRRRQPLLTLLALPIAGTVVAGLTFGTTRYRVSAEVALVLLAAIGLSTLKKRRCLSTSTATPREDDPTIG
ncbi:MAG: hypothetical protein CL467_09305 [Acidimicrobiaceae bacterium]|nr:hypothetical protein [Acidimicrobiaceae bacterium]|tara:strand:+ start:4038 stop:5498 length:1461 start_codon:yes stop_codon:yes gene_type:complete